MRSVLAAAAMIVLLSTPCHAQGMSSAPGVTSPSGGAQGLGKGKGRRGSAQKTREQTPKVDEKAYRSAIDSLPNKPFDPWHDMR